MTYTATGLEAQINAEGVKSVIGMYLIEEKRKIRTKNRVGLRLALAYSYSKMSEVANCAGIPRGI